MLFTFLFFICFQIEDILATFENLIDTTVVNNNTENFLQTVDSLLINMCTGLPLGENSLALSSLGVLKADMNYLDNVDTNFLSVACANCSTLNNSALVKFGSKVIQLMYFSGGNLFIEYLCEMFHYFVLSNIPLSSVLLVPNIEHLTLFGL